MIDILALAKNSPLETIVFLSSYAKIKPTSPGRASMLCGALSLNINLMTQKMKLFVLEIKFIKV